MEFICRAEGFLTNADINELGMVGAEMERAAPGKAGYSIRGYKFYLFDAL